MNHRMLLRCALSVSLVLVLAAAAMAQIPRQRLMVGDLWEVPDGLESPIGMGGYYLVWPAGGETGSAVNEGGFRTNSSGASFRIMFKDFRVETRDSLGNLIDVRTVPYYHPSRAAMNATQPYPPKVVKTVRTYRGSTVVTLEDGSTRQNTVDGRGSIVERSSLICDEMVEYTEFFADGFYVKQTYYAWANPAHDDYVIRVVDIVNNGNTNDNINTSEITPRDFTNLYFDFYCNNLSPNNKGEGYYSYKATGTWDNWHDYHGDAAADGLRFMYAFDGDDPTVPGDDRGDPYPTQYATSDYDPVGLYSPGEFVSAMCAGYGVLYSDRSATARVNDLTQPFSYGYGKYSVAPSWREEQRWVNVFNSGARSFLHPDYTKTVVRELETCWMAFGPYDLPANGKLRFVFVHAVNGPSVARCKEMGQKYLQGQISQAAKDAFLASALDSLTLTIRRAQWNWDNYLSKNQSIPNGPAPPTALRITSGLKAIRLDWKASRSTDVVAYNIYRKAGTNLGDFEKVGSVPATQISYVDSALNLGVSYYYYVTAANDGSANVDPTNLGMPLESSKFFNRSYDPARAYREAVPTINNVRVVPNPFNLFQAKSFPGDADRITFTNLTRRCTIRIFTVNGDLIKTLYKDNPSAFITWSPMLTDDNLFIAPDVYIYLVEDLDSGSRQTGKFVVVR